MKLAFASAVALAALAGAGNALACEDFYQFTTASLEQVRTASAPTVEQMVTAYLQELADEKRIA